MLWLYTLRKARCCKFCADDHCLWHSACSHSLFGVNVLGCIGNSVSAFSSTACLSLFSHPRTRQGSLWDNGDAFKLVQVRVYVIQAKPPILLHKIGKLMHNILVIQITVIRLKLQPLHKHPNKSGSEHNGN